MITARSALADPTICPDCRHRLADSVCTGCGLDLNGSLGQQLWAVMLQADQLIGTIRNRTQEPAPAHSAPDGAQGQGLPADPAARPDRPHATRVSVQGVLLTLGGLLVTVAAIVFLAMSWSALGVGGRTAVLGAVTVALFGAATVLTRRRLGASAETLWLLVGATTVLDVFGAAQVGLWGLDRLSWAGVSGVHALLLSAVAVAAVITARAAARAVAPTAEEGLAEVTGAAALTMRVRGPVGIQLAAALGLTVWGLANLASEAGPLSVWSLPVRASVVALLAGVLAYAMCRREVSIPLVASGAGLAAAGAWCALAGAGVQRFADQAGNYWVDLDGWPLLAAALPASLAVWPLAPATARRGTSTARREWQFEAGWSTVAAVVAVGLISLFAAGPSADERVGLTKVAVGAVLLALLGVILQRRGAIGPFWARGLLGWAAGGALALGWLLATVLADVQDAMPAYGEGTPASILALGDLDVPAWLIGVSAASLLAVLLIAWSAFPFLRAHVEVTTALAAATAGTGIYLIAAVLGAALWLLCAIAFVGAAALLFAAARNGAAERDRSVLLVGAGIALLLSIWDATGSHVLAGTLAGVVAMLAAALVVVALRIPAGVDRLHVLTRLVPASAAGVAAGVFVLTAAVSWFEFAAAAHVASFTVAVVLAAWAALTGLTAQGAPSGPSRSGRGLASWSMRTWVETGAVLVGVSALTLVVDEFEAGVVLTVLGAAVAAVSVWAADRTWCSWISVVLLAGATLCRLESGDPFPEAYSLPVAILLVTGGLWRLRRVPSMSSFTALGAGLGLGFGPSLLLALDDSVSPRALAVFVAAIAVLAFGVWTRSAAPLWAGALAAGSLALVNVLPTIYVLPRWVVLGAVGAVLVGVGITWEARLREARRAGHYLGALR